MEDLTGLKSDQVKQLFILIHGTGKPENAQWTDKKSGLAQKFAERNGASLQRFIWSGRNSHEDRIQAGHALQSELRRLLTSLRREVPVYIVAHSHAGNVALYALRDKWLRQRVTRVACLATPFLHLTRDQLKFSLLMLSTITVGMLLFVLGGTFLLAKLIDIAEISGSFWGAVAAFVLGLLGLLWFLRRKLEDAGLSWSPAEYLRARRVKGAALDAKLQSLELPELSLEQLIALRAASDEAAGALVTAQFLSWAAWAT